MLVTEGASRSRPGDSVHYRLQYLLGSDTEYVAWHIQPAATVGSSHLAASAGSVGFYSTRPAATVGSPHTSLAASAGRVGFYSSRQARLC